MAIIGYLSAPSGDLYRYHVEYNQIGGMAFNEFIATYWGKIDVAIPVVDFILNMFHFNPQILGLISLGTIYLILFRIKEKYISKFSSERTKLLSFVLFIMLFLTIDFFKFSSGIRYGLASYLFAIALLQDVFDKRKNYWLLILAVLVHYSFIAFLPIAFFWERMSNRNVQKLFYSSFVFLFFGTEILTLLFDGLLYFFPDTEMLIKANDYVGGYWGKEYLESRTIRNIILNNMRYVPYYLLVAYFILKKGSSDFRKITLILFSISNLVFSFPNLFGRFITLAGFLGLIVFITEYKKTKWRYWKLFLQIQLAVLALVFVLNIYAARKSIQIGYVPSIIYKPLLFLPFETYDKSWFLENVNSEGLIINPCCSEVEEKKK